MRHLDLVGVLESQQFPLIFEPSAVARKIGGLAVLSALHPFRLNTGNWILTAHIKGDVVLLTTSLLLLRDAIIYGTFESTNEKWTSMWIRVWCGIGWGASSYMLGFAYFFEIQSFHACLMKSNEWLGYNMCIKFHVAFLFKNVWLGMEFHEKCFDSTIILIKRSYSRANQMYFRASIAPQLSQHSSPPSSMHQTKI